jgi:hypothetical protein
MPCSYSINLNINSRLLRYYFVETLARERICTRVRDPEAAMDRRWADM